MKILHLIQTSEGGDWLYQIAKEQKRYGHKIKVVCPQRSGKLVEKLKNENIEVIPIPVGVRSLRDIPKLLLGFIKLTRYIAKERFDVVHSYLFVTVLLGRIAATLARTPIRISTNAGPYYLEVQPSRTIEKFTVFMDDKTICSCEAIRKHYVNLGVPSSKLEVIPFGFALSRFTSHKGEGRRIRSEFGIADNTPLIGIVALFYTKKALLKKWGTSGVKGHEYFLEAAARILKEIPDAVFMIVGDEWRGNGFYRHKLHQMAVELGIEKNVIFTGFRSDVPAIIDAFDVSVQASLTESVGGAAESLIMEKPLVTTNVGGFPDVVRHKETGLLVPPADSIALANAIIYLLQNRAEAAKMASAGKQLVETLFDIKKTAKQIEQAYLTVAKEKKMSL